MALWRGSRLLSLLRHQQAALSSLNGCSAAASGAGFASFASTSTQDEKPGRPWSEIHRPLGGFHGSFGFSRQFSGQTQQTRNPEAEEASRLLDSITAFNMRDRLAEMSEERLHITYSELTALAKKSGAGLTDEDVDEVCRAFVKAGVVFRYKDVIYLKPDEVSEMVLQRLPHRELELERQLEELRLRFAPLAQAKSDIEKEAQTKSMMYLYSGLFFMVTQFVGFYWLTFHELSWDVMEPVAYFFSLGYGIAAYLYFLVNHEDFGFPAFQKRLEKDHKSKVEKVRNFDQARFESLERDILRYERYLSRFNH
ncbi:hypothetical protein BSKO_04118 [Bryopsis sp. KO-2023]|nr:hypothetical protein BSKO_04118 [Bryopsis sp. KO-2023]